jgi:hypothetical protein
VEPSVKWKLSFPRFFVPIDDLAAHLRQADVPIRKGSMHLLGEWPAQPPGAGPVRILAYCRVMWDGFSIGYELAADTLPEQYGHTRLTVSELQNVDIRYTDDRLEAEARRTVPVEDLIELLRRPENQVPAEYGCVVPGGESLWFSPPLKALMFRGGEARGPLLSHRNDAHIHNEVILALGAVGDEATIPALISHYPRGPLEGRRTPAGLTRVCFSYALCWLTGQPIDRNRAGTCWEETNAAKWEAWWATNKDTFRIPAVKPYSTWVPKYPVLADDHIARIRRMFAEGGGGIGIDYE